MVSLDQLVLLVKQNLTIDYNEDDTLIRMCTSAAVYYAECYQHLGAGYYASNPMSPTTRQGIVMLASHFYESRDGSTGGFYNDSVPAARESWIAAERLLRLDRDWQV